MVVVESLCSWVSRMGEEVINDDVLCSSAVFVLVTGTGKCLVSYCIKRCNRS